MIFDNTKSGRIAHSITQMIVQGQMPIGSRLPAERELERQFGVSRVCVRKSLELLMSGGYIIREAGCRPVVVSGSAEPASRQVEMAFVTDLEHDALFDVYRLCYEEFLSECNKSGIRLSYIDISQPLPDYLRGIKFQAVFVAGDFRKNGGFEMLSRLHNEDAKVFLLDSCVDDTPFNVVATDNIQGGELAAQALLDKGCRNLVLVARRCGYHYTPFVDRSTGFVNELHRQGLSCHICNVELKDQQVQLAPLQRYLAEHPETDGIFAVSDALAIDVIHQLNTLGKKVPEQIQVLGFDGQLSGELSRPRLSSIAQPIRQIAVQSLELAKQKHISPLRVMISCTLVERESTIINK